MNYIIHFTYIESINTQLLCGLIVPNSIAKCTEMFHRIMSLAFYWLVWNMLKLLFKKYSYNLPCIWVVHFGAINGLFQNIIRSCKSWHFAGFVLWKSFWCRSIMMNFVTCQTYSFCLCLDPPAHSDEVSGLGDPVIHPLLHLQGALTAHHHLSWLVQSSLKKMFLTWKYFDN